MRCSGRSSGRFERHFRGGPPARTWRRGALRGLRSPRAALRPVVRARFPRRRRVRHLSSPFRCRRPGEGVRGLAARRRARGRARKRRTRPARLRRLSRRGFSGGGGATGRRRFLQRFFRQRPPDDQHLAEMLDRGGAKLVADTPEHRVALGTRVAERTDLNQLVRIEVDVDFVQHRGRQPVLADADHRMQVMRLRAKRAALGR